MGNIKKIKCLNLPLALSLASVVSSILLPVKIGLSQPVDFVCFMQTFSGTIVDLSKLCSLQQSTSVNPDQAFLTDYKRLAGNYPGLGQILLEIAQDSPETVINGAKNYCLRLSAGQSPDVIKAEQTQALNLPVDPDDVQKASAVSVAIENSLATTYYCPNPSSARS